MLSKEIFLKHIIIAFAMTVMLLLGTAATASAYDETDSDIDSGTLKVSVDVEGFRSGDRVKVLLAELGRRVVDGQTHVGAGVPVGDGEDVQVVDGLDIGVQCRIRAEDHFLEGCGIDIVSHVMCFSVF